MLSPEEEKGLISVTLEKRGAVALLSVRDNGAGLPDDFNPHNSTSLGLTLVHMLSEQIDGTFRLENSNGCRAALSFEIP